MCDETRRGAFTAYIVLMVLTVFTALRRPDLPALVLLVVFLQYMALLWYGLSFIPYGRSCVVSCGRCCMRWIGS